MASNQYSKVEAMLGLTLKSITVDNERNEITFLTTCGRHFEMAHKQNCCEYVVIEDIEGDLGDLLDNPLLVSEDVSSSEINARLFLEAPLKHPDADESETWTFYRFATVKGWVVIRWYGTSNGYYSESVDFIERFA